MKCDFCKRDEKEIKEIFAPIFDVFDSKIKELEFQIKNIKEIYPKKHGFIKENFEKVNKINEFVLRMKISTIFDKDVEQFLKLEPNIELLYAYIKKYNPKITKEKSLSDLLNLYINEPTADRLKNETERLLAEKNELLNKYNVAKKDHANFSEIEVDYEIPLNVFEFGYSIVYYIVNVLKTLYNSTVKNNMPRKMLLCPYCLYLFKNSARDIRKKSIENQQSVEKTLRVIPSDDHSSLKEWDFD